MILNNSDIYFIAELGQNHQGDINIAKKMIDELKNTGVSAVKTAKRDIDISLTEEQKNMIYDNPNSFGRTYYEHRKALELSKDDFIKLKNYVEYSGYDFISSYTDINSLGFLIDINVKILKIASSRMADYSLLQETANTNKPIIISSGMCNIDMIANVIDIFKNNEKYLLQCTSSYPCKEEDINLNVLKYYIRCFNSDVNGFGFSSHFSGISPLLLAWMLLNEKDKTPILEAHYTFNHSAKGTDHAASLSIDGIKYIMKYINQMKKSLGMYHKIILDCEHNSIIKLRDDLTKL